MADKKTDQPQNEQIKKKKKMGRPHKELDKEQFEKLCGLQCTLEEIAGFFNCDVNTVETWCKRTYSLNFSEVFKQKRSTGQISLRRMQFKLAEKSAAMAIFLGKNYLGQKDVIEEVNNDDIADDGFMDAIKGTAVTDWSEDGENKDK